MRTLFGGAVLIVLGFLGIALLNWNRHLALHLLCALCILLGAGSVEVVSQKMDSQSLQWIHTLKNQVWLDFFFRFNILAPALRLCDASAQMIRPPAADRSCFPR